MTLASTKAFRGHPKLVSSNFCVTHSILRCTSTYIGLSTSGFIKTFSPSSIAGTSAAPSCLRDEVSGLEVMGCAFYISVVQMLVVLETIWRSVIELLQATDPCNVFWCVRGRFQREYILLTTSISHFLEMPSVFRHVQHLLGQESSSQVWVVRHTLHWWTNGIELTLISLNENDIDLTNSWTSKRGAFA